MHLLRKPLPLSVVIALLASLVLALVLVEPWATGTSAGSPETQGDTDCDEDVDSVDALWDLQEVAGIDNDAKCIGTAGDTDCNKAIEATDGLHILRFVAGLPGMTPAKCTPVGELLEPPTRTPVATATHTPSATPAATPTPTPTPKDMTPGPSSPGITPTATPTPTPTKGTATGTPIVTPTPTIPPPTATPQPEAYDLQAIMSLAASLNRPVEFVMIPGSNDQAIVALQKDEMIMRVSLSNAFGPVLYGDLTSFAGGDGNEEGLLSVAFSPDFETSGRIYAYFTQGGGSGLPTQLSRFTVVSGLVDTGTEDTIITIPDTRNNHNGGRIVFQTHKEADGYLYLSLGDGGGAGDPDETAQELGDLRGKVIRLDVSGSGDGYINPPDNPFVGVAGLDQIFAYGFRNPWRMSADSLTGDIWLGDVGQGTWEEVDKVEKGKNYGWDCYEGNATHELAGCPTPGAFAFPRAAYPNQASGLPGSAGNQAVTGGFVYRGNDMPELYGWYIYGDFNSGRIWAANTADSSAPVLLTDTSHLISSFGETADGEIVVLTFDAGFFKLVPN